MERYYQTLFNLDYNNIIEIPEEYIIKKMCNYIIYKVKNRYYISYLPKKFLTKKDYKFICDNDLYEFIYIPEEYTTLKYWVNANKLGVINYNDIPKKFKTKENFLIFIKTDYSCIKYIKNEWKVYDFYIKLIKNNVIIIHYIPLEFKTKELWLTYCIYGGYKSSLPKEYNRKGFYMEVCKSNGLFLNYIEDDIKTRKLCLIACENNSHAIKYIPDELKSCKRFQYYELPYVIQKHKPNIIMKKIGYMIKLNINK